MAKKKLRVVRYSQYSWQIQERYAVIPLLWYKWRDVKGVWGASHAQALKKLHLWAIGEGFEFELVKKLYKTKNKK